MTPKNFDCIHVHVAEGDIHDTACEEPYAITAFTIRGKNFRQDIRRKRVADLRRQRIQSGKLRADCSKNAGPPEKPRHARSLIYLQQCRKPLKSAVRAEHSSQEESL